MAPPAAWTDDRRGLVLFGAGSPIVVDVEETCLRLNRPILGAVRNMDGPVHTSDRIPVLDANDASVRCNPVVLPLFSPANRLFAWRDATARGAIEFPALIDPTSILPSRIEIAEGVYINAGCVIGGLADLGRFAFVNRGARLGHHLRLGAFASIGPGATIAGQVSIGDHVLIGAGAIVLPGVTIGNHAKIGAGALVTADVAPGVTVQRQR